MKTKPLPRPRFERRTFQGAYAFTCLIDGALRSYQAFADSKREAAAMARDYFRSL